MSVDLGSLEESIELDVDLVPDATLVAHAETGRIIDVNSSTTDLFNCEREYLVGKNQWELHPSNNMDLYREAFKRGTSGERVDRLKNGEPVFVITKDGDRVPVEINVNIVESDGEQFIIGSFREATNHIQRESELEAKKNQLRMLIDALPIPVTIYDSEGEITIWNQECADTVGYPSEVIRGETHSFFRDSEEYEDLIIQSLNGESLDGRRTNVRAADGRKIPVELYTEPVYKNGELDSLVAITMNVSDREQRKRQLNVLQRVLRHNLRNKMTVIKGWMEKMKEEGCTERSVRKVDQASDSLMELTEQVQDIRSTLNDDDVTVPVNVQDFDSELVNDNLTTSYSLDGETMVSSKSLMSMKYLVDRCLDGDDEMVSVFFESDDNSVFMEIESETELLQPSEISYLEKGIETPLDHADDLRVAHVYILIKSVGGDIISSEDNRILVELPRITDSE